MVNCRPGFTRAPAVIDGCSDLLVEVFGDAGRGARSVVGMAELPFDIPVEVQTVVRVGTLSFAPPHGACRSCRGNHQQRGEPVVA